MADVQGALAVAASSYVYAKAMSAYCTTDDLLAVASQLSFSTTTKPSTAQAGAILDFVARELDMAVMGLGWSLPVTDANLLLFLQTANVYGGAAGVFRSRLDFAGAEAWEKKYLGVKKLLPKPETTVGDAEPFGTGFQPEDPDEVDDEAEYANPWTKRSTEY